MFLSLLALVGVVFIAAPVLARSKSQTPKPPSKISTIGRGSKPAVPKTGVVKAKTTKSKSTSVKTAATKISKSKRPASQTKARTPKKTGT